MLFRQVRQAARSRALIFWIVFALLFGQGLRVCVHALGDDGLAHAAPVHLESALAGADDEDSSVLHHDTLLSALFKTMVAALVFCAVLAPALFIFLPATPQVHSRFRKIPPPPPGHHWLTPPGHAPPY